MSWAKLDDRFHGNRKIRRAWRQCRAAVGLHVMAITYCAQYETDGLVDLEFVEGVLPAPKDRDHAVRTLLTVGLWESADEGYWIHDYLEYNPTRQEIEFTRHARVEAGRRGGQASAQARRQAFAQANAQANASANGKANA